VHCGFVTALDQANFLGAGQLFISTDAPDRIAERTGADGRNRDRIVAFHAVFRPELEPDRRIARDFGDSAIESEEFLRSEQDFLLIKDSHG
jgi:hypothetical protein